MAFPVIPISDLVFAGPELQAALVQLPDPRSDLRGRVLAVGPKATEVKVGDMVRLAPGKSIEAVFEQKRTWVTREPEILAVEVDE